MTAKEVLETVAEMPTEEWMKIQSGIAEMLASRFSSDETSEIHNALAEAEAEFARGEGISGSEMRKRLGSMEVASRFFGQLLDACDALRKLPQRYAAYPQARRWRMMPFGNYLVFFQILEEEVRIAHVRHGARRPFSESQ
jgi:plasmid stabilization system protein ParE